MKKKIVAAFCLAMVMTVGGCSGAGTAAQPESSESQTQPASVSESSSSSDASEENSTQKSASSTASSDAADASSSRDIFAMDTYMTVTAYGPNAETAVDQAQQEIERLDALLSTVQMPPGIPVATVGIDGAANAAILAAEILAVSDEKLAQLLLKKRIEAKEAVLEKNHRIEEKWNGGTK